MAMNVDSLDGMAARYGMEGAAERWEMLEAMTDASNELERYSTDNCGVAAF